MLEFVVVYLLAKHNKKLLEDKGRSGTTYMWGTAAMWFGGEILGAIFISLVAGPTTSFWFVYAGGLTGAVIGGLVAWQLAKRALGAPAWVPNAMTPGTGLPVWAQPNGALPPAAPFLPTRFSWSSRRSASGRWCGRRIAGSASSTPEGSCSLRSCIPAGIGSPNSAGWVGRIGRSLPNPVFLSA